MVKGYITCKNKIPISTSQQLPVEIPANPISFRSSKPQAWAFLLGKLLKTLYSQASWFCTSKDQVIPRGMGKREPKSLKESPYHMGKGHQVGKSLEQHSQTENISFFF